MNAPLKIAMMLHFYSSCEMFEPARTRNSTAFDLFRRQLLYTGMIEPTQEAERAECPGWEYRTTEKGTAYVNILKAVPL